MGFKFINKKRINYLIYSDMLYNSVMFQFDKGEEFEIMFHEIF